MASNDLQQSINEQYLPLIRAQYPGFLDGLVDPAVVTLASRLDDLDLAIESLERSYAQQGCENLDDELERVGTVLNDLRRRGGGVPLPQGVLMLTLMHGQPDERQRISVPVKVEASSLGRSN